jgi:hypothetical protein
MENEISMSMLMLVPVLVLVLVFFEAMGTCCGIYGDVEVWT